MAKKNSLVVLLAVALHVCCAMIVDYTFTSLSAASVAQLNGSLPWAVFDDTILVNGTRSAASNFDDNDVFDPLEYCSPFYQLPSAGWYISSNGFLSPSNTAMCSYFCSGAATDYYTGYYKLSTLLPGGGGNWPSIQGYTFDLNPTAGSGAIYKRVYNKTYGNEEIRVAVVEFNSVQQYVAPGGVSDTCTFQIELWPNGTIILRYKKVFAFVSVYGYDGVPPTAGLVLTATQRKYFNNTTPSPGVVRYDPVNDMCNGYASCATCAVASGCTWCGPQSLCVANRVVNDYCAAGQQNLCLLPDVSPWQLFYTLQQSTSSSAGTFAVDALLGDTNLSSVPLNGSWSPAELNLTASSIAVSLPFRMPVFYNPPVRNYSDNTHVVNQVYVDRYGTLGFRSATQSCAYLSYCANGGYSFALVALSTYNYPRRTTSITYRVLPNRSVGDVFCSADVAAVGNRTCREAMVVQVDGVEKFWSVVGSSGQRWSYQYYLDASGLIAIRILSTSAASATVNQCSDSVLGAAYPTPFTGLFKAGASDNSSAYAPWASVSAGTSMLFLPQATCDDCGAGGVCNRTSRTCICFSGFTGDSCQACLPGFYGAACTPCMNCSGHGTCDDGLEGSGGCICAIPYSGYNCSVKCDAPPYTCPGCSSHGGYCSCGQCICNTEMGWSGANCSVWTDPCLALSLDGCPKCTANRPVQCRFCSTYICTAVPTQPGIGVSNYTFPACPLYYFQNQSGCRNVVQPSTATSGLAVIIVIMIFGGLGFGACFVLLLICAFRKPRLDRLLGYAVTGTPDFQFPRREREVIQMVLIPPEGKGGRSVQGIPLKQVPLKELYAYQMERRQRQQQQEGLLQNVRDWGVRREI